jgi:hypothetical protein
VLVDQPVNVAFGISECLRLAPSPFGELLPALVFEVLIQKFA